MKRWLRSLFAPRPSLAPAKRRRPRLRLEELERREMLSVSPIGAEFRVNTYTTGDQRTFIESPGSVATDAAGDFVVTWSSFGQTGDSGWGVYAQRYNAA